MRKARVTQRARSLKSRRAPTGEPVREKIRPGSIPFVSGTRIEPPPRSNEPRRLLSLLTSAERKQYPMASGLMDYFPDALAATSNISWLGNNKHNPGEPLHWARGKSMDHADCILRHHAERGALDTEGVRHSAQLVWRALALLQEELEAAYGLDTPRGASDPTQ